eukprot:gene45675-58354_t
MLLDPSTTPQTIDSASSTFEQLNNVVVGGVGVALADTSAVTDPSVGLSIIQFNNNPYSFVSNATALLFQASLYGEEDDTNGDEETRRRVRYRHRRRLQSSGSSSSALSNVSVTVNVTVQNTSPISYRVLEPSTILVRCLNRTETGYWMNVT